MPVPLLAFLVALAVRLGIVAHGAGFGGDYGYDQGVYYDAAAALLHGRTPYDYHGFVLLHPPLIAVALLPFALIGHLTSDQVGYATANVAFATLGALNAGLVAIVARRIGLGRGAALAGGVLYGVWFAGVNAEESARLEPLGNLLLLLALWRLVEALRAPGAARFGLAGALFGAAANVKIWFALPAVIVVLWLAFAERRGRSAAQLASGIAVLIAVVDGPLLVASRGEMWRMVVTAQLGRRPMGVAEIDRLSQFTTTWWAAGGAARGALALVVATAMAATVVLAARASRWGRLLAALCVAHAVVLALAPSWFPSYGDFAVAPFCLAFAVAIDSAGARARTVVALPVITAAAVTISLLADHAFHATAPWRTSPHLVAAVRRERCVMSDSPVGLIALDALDRDLHDGCRNWVDVTGRTYLGPDRGPLPRITNVAWQRDLTGYLRSGQAAYLALFGHQLSRATRTAVARDGVLAWSTWHGRREQVFRIDPPARRREATSSRRARRRSTARR